MFASSPRQAAQFIRYGHVKVNGVVMKHAGFNLSPGDIFSVNPDRVLQALGRNKPSLKESVDITNSMIRRYNKYLERCKKYPKYMWHARQRFRKRHPVLFYNYQQKRLNRIAKFNEKVETEMRTQLNNLNPASFLKSILLNENYFDKHGTLPNMYGNDVTLKSLSVLRLVTGKKKPAKAESEKASEEAEEADVAAETTAEAAPEAKSESTESDSSLPPVDEAKVDAIVTKYYPPRDKDGNRISNANRPANYGDVNQLLNDIIKIRREDIKYEADAKIIRDVEENEPYDRKWVERLPPPLELIDYEAIQEDPASCLPIRLPWQSGGHYGLQDSSKPYFTPWAPRPFLSPFVIYPHHIEISFETCHAVYLRDPVARPGQSEVITPFPLDMHERAYMFYASKRRK